MTKRFHVTIDVRGYLKLPDRDLAGVLADDDRPLTGAEVRAELERCRSLGYEVVPVCEGHDERGYCRGHEITEGVSA